jgi:hypothetical protein
VPKQAGFRYSCSVSTGGIGVVPPGTIPGLTGRTIYDGSWVIWDAQLSLWDLLAGGGLDKVEADTLYLSLDGGVLTGKVEMPDTESTDSGGTLATKSYVDLKSAAPGAWIRFNLTGAYASSTVEGRLINSGSSVELRGVINNNSANFSIFATTIANAIPAGLRPNVQRFAVSGCFNQAPGNGGTGRAVYVVDYNPDGTIRFSSPYNASFSSPPEVRNIYVDGTIYSTGVDAAVTIH